MHRPIVLTISKVERETPDAVTLHFPQPRVHRIWYKPGQYLPLAVNIGGEKHYRSYSICTSPRLDDTLAVTVKRVPGGLVSNYLNDHAREGDLLQGMSPAGRFYVENSVKERRHLILFGAGSGITPLMAILRSTLFNEPHSVVSLVYVNRNEEQIIFYPKLRDLENKFPDRLKILWFLTQPNKALPEDIHAGRPGRGDISSLLARMERTDLPVGGYFLCGPEAFMQEVKFGLLEAGVGDAQIREEHFFSNEQIRPEIPPHLEDRQVEVTRAGQTYWFLVPAGARILEAGLQQGVPLPYSCRRGECSTCMALCASGEVSMERNEALTDEELGRGLILTCQAYPLTEDVKLQL